ncbi:hypothetical protein FBUS_09194 [Fasciolopsis buskii]|uniref:Uncharacterized protein n=1 Tax=Fasciolopsis buskii TaxID=27845 RepID=A0A8E0RY09_9TREM|nr:hypothetical protein FBUS_09194 [Fasciolopsis buski]
MKESSRPNAETVHLFMSLKGQKLVKRLITMMKTVLYHQNRVRHNNPNCIVSLNNATVLPCPRYPTMVSRTPFHLHLLADSKARLNLTWALAHWNLNNVEWTVYPFEQHQASCLCVICMDTDVILNHDIRELWSHFYQFDKSQPAGVNGGVALHYLKRMREVNWEAMWVEAAKRKLEQVGVLHEGDQIYADVADECCPVVWPLRNPDQIDCWSDIYPNATFRPVKLVHYDKHLKPDDESYKDVWPPVSSGLGKKLTTPQIRGEFYRRFRTFETIDLDCFF